MLLRIIRLRRLLLKAVLFFTILSWTCLSGQCQYTLTLLDSYGDGWNGNSMTVFKTPSTTTTYTLQSGSSISYQISVGLGDTAIFNWQGGGQFQSECSYTIQEVATGTTIYTSPSGNIMTSSTPEFTKSCSSSSTIPCLFNSPYTEAFSGTAGGWVAPSSQFNIGSINSCWDRSGSIYYWVKAPFPGSVNTLSGPVSDHTSGGQGFIGSWPYPLLGGGDTISELITPYISLDNDSLPQVAFWYHLWGDDIDKLEFSITTDTSGTWTILDSLLPNTGAFVSNASPWHQFYRDISAYKGDTVAFKFTSYRSFNGFNSGLNARASIDDFTVTEDTSSCDKPIKVVILSNGVSAATMGWDTTSATNYQVQWAQGALVPSSGTTSITSSNQFSISNLAPNSSYTFRVRGICGSQDTSEWSEYVTIETDCGAFLAPWDEDFESNDWVAPISWFDQGTFGDCFLDSGSLGFYWKVARGPKNQDEGPNTDHSPTGQGKFLATNYRFGSTAPANLSITTPWIALDSVVNPELKFWLHAFTQTTPFGTLSAKIQELNGTITEVFDTAGALQCNQSASWKEMVIPLNQISQDTIRVIFSYDPKVLASAQPFCIDDISIVSGASCPRPFNLTIDTTSTDSATLSWTSGGAQNHQIRYKELPNGIWTYQSSSSNQLLVTNLTANTLYRWEVQDSCSNTNQSIWVRGPNFYTKCSVFTAPITRSFNQASWQPPSSCRPSGSIGNCFTRFEDDANGYYWTGARSGYDHFAFTGPNNDHTGGTSGYFFANATSQVVDTANMEFPEVSLGQVLSPEFSFWYHMYGFQIDRLNVFVRRIGGADSLISTIIGQQQSSANQAWLKQTCSLNGYQSDTVVITFQAIKKGSGGFFPFSSAICIDDIEYGGTVNCPPPQQLSATNITPTQATISWQGVSSASRLEYGPNGFALGTGAIINPTSSPTLLIGLAPNTTYTVYVRDSCGASTVSTNTVINFTTLPCPSVVAAGTMTLNGTTATGNNTGSTNDSIVWLWGDGNTSFGDSVTYTYPLPGIYSVQQVAYNGCGSSDTISYSLTVCSIVDANISTLNNGLTIDFNGSGSIGAGLIYQWLFGDGSSATAVNPTHTYASAGVYTVILVATDACGTSDSTSINLSVCPTVLLNFNYTNSGNQFSFNAIPLGLTSYQWDFGDGNSGNGMTTTHTYLNAGNYLVSLTAIDSCSGTLSSSDSLSTCAPLSANFTFNLVSSGASGLLVSFFATVSGSSGLIWDWGDGTQTTTQATSISHNFPTVSFNYNVSLIAFNECGDTLVITKSLNEIGLDEEKVKDEFSINPNPSRQNLVEILLPENIRSGLLEVWTTQGIKIVSRPFKETNQIQLNTSVMAPGIYLVRISNMDSEYVKRLVQL
jgi:PKD repeat protein